MKRLAVLFLVAILASCTNDGHVVPTPQPKGLGHVAPTPQLKGSGRVVPKSTVIAHGEAYDKSDYLIPGKIVILDFYADW